MSMLATHLENDELKLGDIVWMDPVLRGLSDEVLLASPRGSITLGGVASTSNQII